MHSNHIYGEDFKKPFEEGGMSGHVDLPRLKEGKNGGAFLSAFVPCPKNGSDFSDENYADCKSLCCFRPSLTVTVFLLGGV